MKIWGFLSNLVTTQKQPAQGPRRKSILHKLAIDMIIIGIAIDLYGEIIDGYDMFPDDQSTVIVFIGLAIIVLGFLGNWLSYSGYPKHPH